jgi:protein SCO1/2
MIANTKKEVAMKYLLLILMMVVVAGFTSGCGKGSGDKEKIYDIKGKVVSLDPGKKKILLDHEEIPGYMMAMEMSFDVADAKILEGLKPGDPVRGKLKRTAAEPVITELHKQ